MREPSSQPTYADLFFRLMPGGSAPRFPKPATRDAENGARGGSIGTLLRASGACV